MRAIGLSNFYDGRYIDICEHADVKPAVVQLEAHVFSQQKRMRELMRAYGTRLMAWAPFAEGRNGLFTTPTLEAIGRRHGKSAAQTALRYLSCQRATVALTFAWSTPSFPASASSVSALTK